MYYIFADILRKCLKEKRITQKMLAKYLGLSNTAVNAYVMGANYPDIENLLKIAEYLNVSIDYLLTGKKLENKSVRDELKLSENAVNNLKTIAEKFNGTFFALDTLLADEGFFTNLTRAVNECIRNKMMYENLSRQQIGELTELLNSVIGSNSFSLRRAAIDNPSQILQDYFIMFFSRYWNNLDNLTDEQKQLIKSTVNNEANDMRKDIKMIPMP